MKHISYYKERMLYCAFLVFFATSVLLLFVDMDSFTAMAMETAQIAQSCEQTVPLATSCVGGLYGECAELNSKQYVLNQKGDAMCCCVPLKYKVD